MSVHGEPLHQQQADEERGGGVPEERDAGQHVVADCVPLHGLVHAERNAEQQRDDGAQRDQHYGLGQVLADQAGDRLVELGREAQVAVQQLADPLDVLDVERLVETVQVVVMGDLRRGGARAQQRPDGPAREQVHQREHDDRHEEQDDDSLHDAPEQVPDHRAVVPPAGPPPASRHGVMRLSRSLQPVAAACRSGHRSPSRPRLARGTATGACLLSGAYQNSATS